MVFTKQRKKLTAGLCQIYNRHDCKKRNAIKILQFLQSILECSLFTTSLLQFLQSLITCDKGLQKIQQKCGRQNTIKIQSKYFQCGYNENAGGPFIMLFLSLGSFVLTLKSSGLFRCSGCGEGKGSKWMFLSTNFNKQNIKAVVFRFLLIPC